jgi:hypothetical protein
VEPYYVRVLFVTLMALKDRDMIVRRSAFSIAQRGHMTEKEVLEGLNILSKPDKRRLEAQPFDGRRIEKVEGGWLILNGEKYRQIISTIKRRDYQSAWQKEYRKRRKFSEGTKDAGQAAIERGLQEFHGK